MKPLLLLLLLLLLHWSCMELQHKGGVTREESAAASVNTASSDIAISYLRLLLLPPSPAPRRAQAKELLQASKPVRDADWNTKEVECILEKLPNVGAAACRWNRHEHAHHPAPCWRVAPPPLMAR